MKKQMMLSIFFALHGMQVISSDYQEQEESLDPLFQLFSSAFTTLQAINLSDFYNTFVSDDVPLSSDPQEMLGALPHQSADHQILLHAFSSQASEDLYQISELSKDLLQNQEETASISQASSSPASSPKIVASPKKLHENRLHQDRLQEFAQLWQARKLYIPQEAVVLSHDHTTLPSIAPCDSKQEPTELISAYTKPVLEDTLQLPIEKLHADEELKNNDVSVGIVKKTLSLEQLEPIEEDTEGFILISPAANPKNKK